MIFSAGARSLSPSSPPPNSVQIYLLSLHSFHWPESSLIPFHSVSAFFNIFWSPMTPCEESGGLFLFKKLQFHHSLGNQSYWLGRDLDQAHTKKNKFCTFAAFKKTENCPDSNKERGELPAHSKFFNFYSCSFVGVRLFWHPRKIWTVSRHRQHRSRSSKTWSHQEASALDISNHVPICH